MPADTGAVNALREGVAHLQEALQPTEAKISELEAEIAHTRGQLVRWERALAEAEGRSLEPTPRRTTTGSTSVQASEEDLTAWRRTRTDDDGWVGARAIRDALNISEAVPGPKVTAWLAAATGVESNGVAGPGRKYRAAP